MFESLNFVKTCQTITEATSSIEYCFDPAVALNEILLTFVLFSVVIVGVIYLLRK